jgi:Restriction endonuclease fold toxin 5
MDVALPMRQLQERGRACRGLVVDADGVALGADCVLVRRTSSGYRTVDTEYAEQLFKLAFGNGCDTQHLMMQLRGVERALNDNNLVKAQILGLQSALAGVGAEQLEWLDRVGAILKYDDSQPRDNDGRWTSGAAGSGASATDQTRQALEPDPAYLGAPAASEIVKPAIEELGPPVLSLLARLAAAIAAPVALGGVFALIPTNGSNIHYGDIPGRPDLSYRSDEGILTISRLDDQGNVQRVYEGFPDSAGLYRDSTGRVIGQHVGTGVVFSLDSLPLFGGPLETGSPDPDSEPESFPNSSAGSDDPKNCPPPTIEIDNGKRSARATAYQSQITGLLPGFDVLYNGVRFDGCDEVTQRMLEAKGHGSEWRFVRYPDSWIGENYYDETMSQVERQNGASAGRGVDWHFADRGEALFFYLEFKAHHFENVRVYYTEAIMKKAENCIIWIKDTLQSMAPYEDISAENFYYLERTK